MTTGKKVNLDYVAIEVITKNATKDNDPSMGLFRGIRSRALKEGADEKSKLTYWYLLTDMTTDERAMKGFSLDAFNILSTRVRYNNSEEVSVFKATDEDQKLAFDFLSDIVKAMEKENRMVDNDTEIINMNTYKNVPDSLSKKTTKTNTSGVDNKPKNWGGYPSYNTGQTSGTDWEAKRKEKERQEKLRQTPTVIKRKNKLPSEKMLEKMREKVLEIAAGTYEVSIPEEPKACQDAKKTLPKKVA